MARAAAVGIVVGVLWGLVAAAVFAAMRAHVLPAPSEVALPLAVALILVYLPVNVAIGVLVAVSRSSPSLVDLVGVTLAWVPRLVWPRVGFWRGSGAAHSEGRLAASCGA